MTALDKYVRLESGGLWRAGPDAQRRDVVVSFGDATLVISDPAGRPLSHWSLPALVRENPGERPAIYVPDEGGSEALEIAEDTMISAIEEVRKALAKTRPNPGKLRHWVTGISVVAVIALGIFWLPGALMRQTLAVVPSPKRVEIGATILGYIQDASGQACQTSDGITASERLAARLFGQRTPNQIVVMPELGPPTLTIPGGIILLDRAILRTSDDPAAIAGYVLAEQARRLQTDPLEPILRDAGFGTTLRLLTTGEIPAETIKGHALKVLSTAASAPDADTLSDAFTTAQVPSAPFLSVVETRDENVPDISINPEDAPPILSDSDWISLQNICNS